MHDPLAQHGRMVCNPSSALLSVLCSAGEYTDVERISIPVGAIVAARNCRRSQKAPAELGALAGAISRWLPQHTFSTRILTFASTP